MLLPRAAVHGTHLGWPCLTVTFNVSLRRMDPSPARSGAQPSPQSWGWERGKKIIQKGMNNWNLEHGANCQKGISDSGMLLVQGACSCGGDNLLCLKSWNLVQPLGAAEGESWLPALQVQ